MSESTTNINRILQTAAAHQNEELQKLLNTYSFPDCASVDVLDPESGRCPLHYAIASCVSVNGESIAKDAAAKSNEDLACETVRLLFENGAIWNQLDMNNDTPGCLARRLGLLDLYQLMVDAGVRAEMLLNRLDGYEMLEDDMEDDEDENYDEVPALVDSSVEVSVKDVSDQTQTADFQADDVNSTSYLSSVLSFDKDKLLDDQNNGVMMEWERDIMKRSATGIVDQPNLKILNIGAGMLIFDSIVQGLETKPAEHHIVEAHPDVLAMMTEKGWQAKDGVTIHPGKWQDVLPSLVAAGNTYDAVYFDTFAESYGDFKEFFSEQVIGLLNEGGKWSFFNGMGADRQISYDVYQKVVEMDLFEAGFDVEWHEVDVPTLDAAWEGVKRRYWNIDQYRLPICKFMN